MGKWTVQATDEILLAKIRVAVQDAIQTHRNEKHQEGEARPVSFMEFCEEFDAKDAFTARLMEILVKEYSERRAKTTPVERRLQIASRTSKALGAIPRDATVYDNCRPGRWPRTRYPSSLRRHPMEEDDTPGRVDRDEDIPITSAARDQLFQNALNELEDGEFGAHWNSSLNEVYADEGNPYRWRRTETFRPILHDVDMAAWHVSAERDDLGLGAVRSTSPSSFDSEMESLAQSQEALSRLRARVGSLSDSLGHRVGSSRLPLVRRHSLRRSRFGRSSGTLESDTALRRRLARGLVEDGDVELERPGAGTLLRGPALRRANEGSGETESPRAETMSSGSALRRLWADYPIGTTSAAASGSDTTLTGRRGLRQGGVQAPETLAAATRVSFPSPQTSTLRPTYRSLSINQTPDGLDHATDMLHHYWFAGSRDPHPTVPTGWEVPAGVQQDATAPVSPIPTDSSNIRVRWTENLVNFPVDPEVTEFPSVILYPEQPQTRVVDSSIPRGEVTIPGLPQPDSSAQ